MSNLNDNFEDTVHANFVLRPSRSMTGSSKLFFYGSLAGMGGLAAVFTVASGAWPVGLMLGATIGGTAYAMKMSDRSRQEYQRIEVSDSKLEVFHHRPGWPAEQSEEFVTFGLRVETKCDHDGNCEKLLIGARGVMREIGAFLPPSEKLEVADALKEAIRVSQMPVHLRATDIESGPRSDSGITAPAPTQKKREP